jgi:hypothetical protein
VKILVKRGRGEIIFGRTPYFEMFNVEIDSNFQFLN